MAAPEFEEDDDVGSGTALAVPVDPLVSTDGTDALCLALYGRKAKPADYLGGSEAKMLYDAAKVVDASRCIRHWHDSGDDGMVVSTEHVQLLWDALPDEC
ncbi:MAG: hypothetical protein M3H12_18680 [Chromatiales bacterium]|nr:hypothetical protein [Gammaproteobacteria bacterium]